MFTEKSFLNIRFMAPCMLMLAGVLVFQDALANDPYKNNAISENIHVNCKNFSIASNGVLSADCNAVKRTNSQGVVYYDTAQKTIDLDDYLGNDLGSTTGLSWSHQNISAFCSTFSVSVHSGGVTFSANCDYLSGIPPTVTVKRKSVNLNAGIKCDSSGNFAGR